MSKLVEEKLGRPVQLLKDPAVKGKPTGRDLCVPTIDVSAVDPTVEIKNRPPGRDRRRGETPLRDTKDLLG